jgi:hypothetical protein
LLRHGKEQELGASELCVFAPWREIRIRDFHAKTRRRKAAKKKSLGMGGDLLDFQGPLQ